MNVLAPSAQEVVTRERATITRVSASLLSVPLPRPVAWANVQVSRREYVIVKVETSDGVEGVGFTLGSRFENGGRVIQAVVNDVLAPVVVGQQAVQIERLWEEMTFRAMLLGRSGAAQRAIAAVDIALWDALGKSVDRPLSWLLGEHRTRVPVYASGGYYYSDEPGRDLEELKDEITRQRDLGFTRMKIKIGRRSPYAELERVQLALDLIGPEGLLAVDANNAWRDAPTALHALRPMDDLGLWWIEEPVLPDQYEVSARIAAELRTPVATGEMAAGQAAFTTMVQTGAAAILQADATVIGGITEWRKVAAMATCHGVPLAPHWVPDIHLPLAACDPNVLALEYFDPGTGVLNLDELLVHHMQVENGEAILSDRPGHGLVFDPDKLSRYEVN